MTWTKTSDDFPERMFAFSSDAYRLHHAATSYANRLHLDGRILKGHLSMVPVPPRVRRRAVIQELVGAKLWVDDGDAWTLTDFLTAQPTKEADDARHAYDAVRQRLRFARAAVRRHETPPVPVAQLEEEERRAKERFNAAREHQRELLSQSESPRRSLGNTQRPDPSRPNKDEGEDRTKGVRVTSPGSPALVGPQVIGELTVLTGRGASFREVMAAAGLNADEFET